MVVEGRCKGEGEQNKENREEGKRGNEYGRIWAAVREKEGGKGAKGGKWKGRYKGEER